MLQFLGLPQRRSITRYRVLAKKDHLVINQTVTELTLSVTVFFTPLFCLALWVGWLQRRTGDIL
jgi:hypothetical protein